jgi:hypothetical protein
MTRWRPVAVALVLLDFRAGLPQALTRGRVRNIQESLMSSLMFYALGTFGLMFWVFSDSADRKTAFWRAIWFTAAAGLAIVIPVIADAIAVHNGWAEKRDIMSTMFFFAGGVLGVMYYRWGWQ